MHNNDKLIIANMRQQNKTDKEISDFLNINESDLEGLDAEVEVTGPFTQEVGRFKRVHSKTPSITVKGESAVLDTVKHMLNSGHNITIGE